MSKMNIIIMGPQASGKGTQASKIAEDYGIPHISTGDIFRENIKNKTELGKKVIEYTNSGKLVPDEITIEIVKERVSRDDCKKGFLLDGFPRTISQAEALDEIITITKVISVELHDDVCIKRVSGRFMNKAGKIYNIYTAPKPKKIEFDEEGNILKAYDDKTEEELYQRDDDKPEAVKKRLSLYHEQTEPIKDYYKKREGVVAEINGDQPIDDVYADIKKALEE